MTNCWLMMASLLLWVQMGSSAIAALSRPALPGPDLRGHHVGARQGFEAVVGVHRVALDLGQQPGSRPDLDGCGAEECRGVPSSAE